jgi:diguanylate cyclase (GGDEF)-like protein
MASPETRLESTRQTAGDRRLEMMETLGRLIVEARDSDDVRDQIVVAFVEGLHCQRASLWELAAEGGYFIARSEVRPPDDPGSSVVGLQVTLSGAPLLSRLVKSSRPLLLDEAEHDQVAGLIGEKVLATYELATLLAVPLFHFAQLIGFLLVDQPESEAGFFEEDLALAQAGATYAALVLENLRNRIAEQQRGERMTALARLAATITTRHSLAEVLPEIARHGAALVRSATCTVLLVGDDNTLYLAAQAGLPELDEDLRIPLDDPLVKAFIEQDTPLVVEDIDQQMPGLRRLLVGPDVRAILLLPLRVAGSTIGALTLGYLHTFRPDRAELNLAETLASVAAGAIQNARAFEMEIEQRNLLRTVAEISRRVSGILDTEWMLREVCSLLGRELGYDFVHALLVKETGSELAYVAGSGSFGQLTEADDFHLPLNRETLVGEAVKASKPQRQGDRSPRLFGYTREQLARVQSEIALPIVAHNHAIGALVVQSEQADAFDLEDERLLKIVTDQISVALDNARHHAEVQAQARLDSLTQVLNHGAFVATLHTLVKHCREEETSLSLIMLDVDLFKEYNDRFGHVAGDAALKTTVQAIRAHVKSRDAVGRWGGEEFGIAFIGADKEQAYGVAQRIRETLASLVPVDRLGREMPPPSVSQGIATLDVDAKDADNLVDVADQALYQAKGAGRDQVRLAGQD